MQMIISCHFLQFLFTQCWNNCTRKHAKLQNELRKRTFILLSLKLIKKDMSSCLPIFLFSCIFLSQGFYHYYNYTINILSWLSKVESSFSRTSSSYMLGDKNSFDNLKLLCFFMWQFKGFLTNMSMINRYVFAFLWLI